MSYSLSNAAAACGVYKSTVLRSIKSGRLTATKDALGQWRIEPAELHRVYPPVQSNGAEDNATRHDATAALIEAQHRAELAEQRLADLKTVGACTPGDWRWPTRGSASRGGSASPADACHRNAPLPAAVVCRGRGGLRR